MVNFNKGSPDPDNTENLPNYVDAANFNEADDNDEEVYNGYEPLGMQDFEEDNVITDSDEEASDPVVQENNANNSNDPNFPPIEPIETTLVREVWTEASSSDIPLDDNKIDEIKQLMKGITLPVAAMPDWVTNDDIVSNLVTKTRAHSK
ncbi:unnamed protein product [Brassicogethes aeneus]|uniref:Male-enhanced antigen 1 n=1 Tax=Brassicogethes aeneus TaxID=1431903 RepID=A0A9P0BDP7_BRAAE|nr:unnamed protein product [Brassicogethes aeneus]